VLVADDSPIVLEIVTSILRGAELLPQAACDGEAAWQALEEELPDLLLTDVDMPRLDGLGLLRRVRERWPRLPVVVLTTRGGDEDRSHAMSLGANEYLVKSELDEGRLIEIVRGLIDAAGTL
jgi:CheY-like chemotaxis protein